MRHPSQNQGLCLKKWPNKMLQNLRNMKMDFNTGGTWRGVEQ